MCVLHNVCSHQHTSPSVCLAESKLSTTCYYFFLLLFHFFFTTLSAIPQPTWADRPLPFFPGSPEDVAAKMQVRAARKQKKLRQVCITYRLISVSNTFDWCKQQRVVKAIITQLLLTASFIIDAGVLLDCYIHTI